MDPSAHVVVFDTSDEDLFETVCRRDLLKIVLRRVLCLAILPWSKISLSIPVFIGQELQGFVLPVTWYNYMLRNLLCIGISLSRDEVNQLFDEDMSTDEDEDKDKDYDESALDELIVAYVYEPRQKQLIDGGILHPRYAGCYRVLRNKGKNVFINRARFEYLVKWLHTHFQGDMQSGFTLSMFHSVDPLLKHKQYLYSTLFRRHCRVSEQAKTWDTVEKELLESPNTEFSQKMKTLLRDYPLPAHCPFIPPLEPICLTVENVSV